jgi:dynein heavy chain
VAGAAPPSGSRADLTPRFTTHFNMFCLPPANEAMLQKIFGSILEGFLKTGFSEKVQQLKDAVVNSTIEVYRRITSELRATPSKFHYTFNLRDVSKVFQGILMTKPVSIQTETQFTRLWVNETLRVFHDRLNTDSDVTYFIDLMMEMLNGFFKSGQNRDELFGESKVMFGDLLRLDVNRMYEEITNKDKLKKVLEGKLEDYNSGADQRMSLVFFSDAIHHILRICRALRQPRGNIMLIGVGGSGKQSLTKLSAAMYDIKYKVIEMKKDYKISDFRDFIKGIMFATAGIEREKKIPEPTVFTLTDS